MLIEAKRIETMTSINIDVWQCCQVEVLLSESVAN